MISGCTEGHSCCPFSSQPSEHTYACPVLGLKETHIWCYKMVVKVSQETIHYV